MSEPPAEETHDIPPSRPPGGSRLLGVALGVVYVAAFIALNLFFPAQNSNGALLLLIVPLVVFLVPAILLTVRPGTARLGAGMLMSFGISLLVGAGLCIALISGIGSA